MAANDSSGEVQMRENRDDRLRSEYAIEELGPSAQAKYGGRLGRRVLHVTIQDDLAEAFPDAESVNTALRSNLAIKNG